MRSWTICFAAVVSLLFTGEFKMLLAAEASEPLVLTVTTVALDGKARNEFAAKEPIWVRVSLENVSDRKVSGWCSGEKGYGVEIEPNKDSKDRTHAVDGDRQGVVSNKVFRPMNLEPKAKFTFDVLLADWLNVTGEGAVNLQATLGLMDEKWHPIQVRTAFSFTLKGQLDKKGLDALLKSVQVLYSSDAVADRIRAVDSVRAIRVPDLLPLLAKAIADKDEILQYHAVQSLLVLPYPEVIPILKKALESTDPAVRAVAKNELDRREKH